MADAIPEVAGGEGSDVQAIVISGFPEMGLNDKSALKNATLVELGEASPILAAIQVIHLSRKLLVGQRGPSIPGPNVAGHYCLIDCS